MFPVFLFNLAEYGNLYSIRMIYWYRGLLRQNLIECNKFTQIENDNQIYLVLFFIELKIYRCNIINIQAFLGYRFGFTNFASQFKCQNREDDPKKLLSVK